MQPDNHSGEIKKIPWAYLRVPPFPQIALRVLCLSNDENMSMRRLSDLISSDPAFSSEVITIANSALVAHRLVATSAQQAVKLLGMETLKGVCLTVGMRAYLGTSMNYSSLRVVWRHSLACALIAEQLSLAGWVDRETAYTAGIMHEIGRFALASIRPREYANLLDTHRGVAQSILKAEVALFGFDHCELGRYLVAEWRLPLEFEPMMSEQDSSRLRTDPWNLADLVHMSCKMADAAGFTAFPGCEAVPFSDLLSQLPVRERSLFHAEIKDLSEDVEARINAIEAM